MRPLRLYLDNCCFNRPFDDQSQLAIRLETEAILRILELIRDENCELIWSSVIDFENKNNPFESRREAVGGLRKKANRIVEITNLITQTSVMLQSQGLDLVDSLHVACAIDAGCKYFVTTDYKVINKPVKKIALLNPVRFIEFYEEITPK